VSELSVRAYSAMLKFLETSTSKGGGYENDPLNIRVDFVNMGTCKLYELPGPFLTVDTTFKSVKEGIAFRMDSHGNYAARWRGDSQYLSPAEIKMKNFRFSGRS